MKLRFLNVGLNHTRCWRLGHLDSLTFFQKAILAQWRRCRIWMHYSMNLKRLWLGTSQEQSHVPEASNMVSEVVEAIEDHRIGC
ncbi:hypothetical protein ANCCAN_07448 [Ancylostoma caninum]|uniref:Uncharacterized protein n=1 Tax=Ancylostoma caninum TaxID=29170 RepID=A0A368GSI7_ANCCA|nr:hypothetical protein ANCCAN_07448 [Ancylostoma caninum]